MRQFYRWTPQTSWISLEHLRLSFLVIICFSHHLLNLNKLIATQLLHNERPSSTCSILESARNITAYVSTITKGTWTQTKILLCRTVHLIFTPNDAYDLASVTDRIFNSIMRLSLIPDWIDIERSNMSKSEDHADSLFQEESLSLLRLISARRSIIF